MYCLAAVESWKEKELGVEGVGERGRRQVRGWGNSRAVKTGERNGNRSRTVSVVS